MKLRRSSINTKDTFAKIFGYKKGDRVRLTQKVPRISPKISWFRKARYFKKGRIGTIYFVFDPPLTRDKKYYIDFNSPLLPMETKSSLEFCLVREDWIEIA